MNHSDFGNFNIQFDGLIIPDYISIQLETFLNKMTPIGTQVTIFPISYKDNMVKVDFFLGKEWLQEIILNKGLAKVNINNLSKIGMKKLLTAEQYARIVRLHEFTY